MKRNMGLLLVGAAILIGVLVHTLGQTAVSKRAPWLEPKNPTCLEWLVLEKQASEGDNEFGDNGVTVNFYFSQDSVRTGEMLCDLTYLQGTKTEMIQIIEEGIQKRFEVTRKLYPWARVKIIKKVARL